MRKTRWILLGSMLIVFAAAIVVVFEKQPGGDSLPSLRPFIAQERVMYYNPSELLKSVTTTTTAPAPPGSMDPMMIRIIKVNSIPISRLSAAMHKDLSAKKGWNFMPWPYLGMPKSTSVPQEIIAYQGKSMGTPPGMAFGIFGGGVPGDHVIVAIPDTASDSMSISIGDLAIKPSPYTFMIIEQKKLSKLDVLLLRMKSVGKNPFASEKDLTSFAGDF